MLGVSRQASAAEIRSAYAKLAREKHPDRFLDPAEKQRAHALFSELTTAFNTLANERTRNEYEAQLAKPKLTSPEEIAGDAYARGLQAFEARQYAEAVELFRSAVYHGPADARYHAALGRALGRTPQGSREAIQHAEKAVELQPQQAAFHALLAELYHQQGLRIRARKVVDAALRLAPQDPNVKRVASLIGGGE